MDVDLDLESSSFDFSVNIGSKDLTNTYRSFYQDSGPINLTQVPVGETTGAHI